VDEYENNILCWCRIKRMDVSKDDSVNWFLYVKALEFCSQYFA